MIAANRAVRLRDYADLRVFSSAADAKPSRRPTDVVLLSVSLLGLWVISSYAEASSTDRALMQLVGAMPGLLDWFWEVSYFLLAAWLVVALAAALVARGRAALTRDQILALGLGAAASAWAGVMFGVGWDVFADGLDASPPPSFPAVRLALAIAVIATTSPHLGRPIRHAGRWIMGVGAVATLALELSSPLGLLAGACAGFAAAALVHLIFGSPGGRATTEQIERSMVELGVPVSGISTTELSARGVQMVEARAEDGRRLIIKVHGRDAWDGQLIAVAWTKIWFRNDAENVTLSPRSQVEHEALVALMAERGGVPVQPLASVGITELGDAIVAVEERGIAMDQLAADGLTDDVIDAAWRTVLTMHAAGIAHSAIDAGRLRVAGEDVVLSDFAAASVRPRPEQVQRDLSQWLLCSAMLIGPQRATRAALEALGAERLAPLLPFLQPAILTTYARQMLKRDGTVVDAVRDEVASACAVEVPKLAPLRRFTWGWVVKVTIIAILTLFLMESLTGMDLAAVSSAIADASQEWIWIGLVIGILATVAQAFSTMGAANVPLSFPPSFNLQLAIQFMALLVPSSAARVALGIRFFQKMGQTATTATMIGAVDALSGFTIQVLLLAGIFLTGLADLGLSSEVEGQAASTVKNIDWGAILGILLLLAAVVGFVALKLPKVRAFAKDKIGDVRLVVRNLRSPGKAVELLLGNLAGQVLLAIALGACLKAFGYSANLAQLILITTFVSLFAGLMPVPGGVGVSEAALTAGLVSIGIPQDIAVSTAIVFRLVTFYLPPTWGWLGTRWLRAHDYL